MTIDTQPQNPVLYDAWTMAFSGNVTEARVLASSILDGDPDNEDASEALAVFDLGLDLTKVGRTPGPRVDDATLFAARTLYAEGKREEAAQRVGELLADHGDDPDLRCLAGEVALTLGGHAIAIDHFTAALERDPFHVRALMGRGAVFLELDDHEENMEQSQDYLREAAAAYRVVLIRNPDLVPVLLNMGVVHQRLHDLDKAAECFERCLAVDPENLDAHAILGSILLIQGWGERAHDHFEKALEIRPDHPAALLNMGGYHRQWGDKDEALKYWDRLLALHPRNPMALENVSELRKYTPDHPEIATIREMMDNPDRPVEQRRALEMALYNALNRIGEKEEALPHLWEANRLRHGQVRYSFEMEQRRHETTKALFAGRRPLPVPAETEVSRANPIRPLFIVGLPRSGSTLTEQILASHSQVTGIGEAPCFPRATRDLLVESARRGTGVLTARNAAKARDDYLEQLLEREVTTPVVVDKMLWNYRHVGFLLMAFPDARIIVMNRDPMAVGWSIWKLFFADNGPQYAYDLGEIGQAYRLFTDLMDFWRARFPGRLYDLCYERLTENQEEETRALLDFCGLPFEEGCLRFHETKRLVCTASNLQVKKAMYKGSSDAWKVHAEALSPLAEALAKPLPAPPPTNDLRTPAFLEAASRGSRGDFQGAYDILEALTGLAGQAKEAERPKAVESELPLDDLEDLARAALP